MSGASAATSATATRSTRPWLRSTMAHSSAVFLLHAGRFPMSGNTVSSPAAH